MIYYVNGGFNWHDLYYMPVKLREFYYRELVAAKESENEKVNSANRKSNSTSKIRRK